MSAFIKYFSEKFNKNKQHKRGYEGATTSPSFRWQTNTTLANLETQISLETLRNRARQLVRDNAFAESAVAKISSNVIGTGIIPEFQGDFDQNIW
ncbi:MAG: phage portal protein, partial [Bdellovibrionota bacterium]